MTAVLEWSEWSAVRPGRTLPQGKTRYPFYRRLGGPQGRSGRAENLVPTGIRSQTVQPVVSRYTDWTTRPNVQHLKRDKFCFKFVIPSLYSWNVDMFFTSEPSQVIIKDDSVITTTASVLLLMSVPCHFVIGKFWQKAKWSVIKRGKNDIASERHI